MHWHLTGDAGRLDEQGRLWLLGPVSAALEGPRGTVYPLSVDTALEGHAHVLRATVVPENGSNLLVVQPRGELTQGQAAAIAARVPWAGATAVVVVEAVPCDRRHAWKIDHPALRAMLAERRWKLRAPVQAKAARDPGVVRGGNRS